ncbi:MAG: glycosyltransferase family 4 protein [Candidatus Gastranaerophilales bacterium]|nr:glycosyltransferase family 4 protein [Candidatus Gastranaerophilales bacterium]
MKRIAVLIGDVDALLDGSPIKGGGSHVARYLLLNWIKRNDVALDVFSCVKAKVEHPEFNRVEHIPFSLGDNIEEFIADFEAKKGDAIYDAVIIPEVPAPKYSSFLHSHSFLFRYDLYSSPFMRKLFKFINRKKINFQKKYFSDKSETFIAVSEKIKADYSKNLHINENKIKVVYPGVTVDESFERKENNLFTFGLVSGITSNKGFHLFLAAMKNVLKKDKNVRGLIINPTPKDTPWARFFVKILGLEKYVTVLDYQVNISEFYKQIDAIVVPSRHEAFALVAIEAASYKAVPVVSCNAGFSELINNSQNGFVFDINKKSLKNLSKALLDIVDLKNNHKDSLLKIREAAFETAKSRSWSQFAGEVFDSL